MYSVYLVYRVLVFHVLCYMIYFFIILAVVQFNYLADCSLEILDDPSAVALVEVLVSLGKNYVSGMLDFHLSCAVFHGFSFLLAQVCILFNCQNFRLNLAFLVMRFRLVSFPEFHWNVLGFLPNVIFFFYKKNDW